ncbi:MAG: alternative ribosome rescue aminoacyl-tRNA hydrolase ArfB [Bacteroidota bacterium]
MKIDITNEILFQTARSGGKGGQNVNKVETMVEGRWMVASSQLLTGDQKQLVTEKIANKITDDGFLLVKSQTERSQLGNKQEVIRKMNQLVSIALTKQKIRRATKPTRAAKEKRIESKKRNTFNKELRKKINKHDY